MILSVLHFHDSIWHIYLITLANQATFSPAKELQAKLVNNGESQYKKTKYEVITRQESTMEINFQTSINA